MKQKCEKCGKDAIFFDVNLQLWLCEECVNKEYKSLDLEEFKQKNGEDKYNEELNNIFESLEIHPRDLKGIPSIEYTSKGGRLYARTGGVSIAVSEAVEELYPDKIKNFKSRKAEGVKECKAVLNEALAGKANASFIEGMGCIGGCVGGPKILVPPEEGKKAVDNFAYDASIKVAVHSKVLDDVLDKLGITSLKDFEDPKKINILERKF